MSLMWLDFMALIFRKIHFIQTLADTFSEKKLSICPFRYASMYLNERTSGTINNPIFSMCCSKGKVDLPQLNPLPTWYFNFIKQIGPLGRHFISKIRLYNSAFAFSSFNAKVLIIFIRI